MSRLLNRPTSRASQPRQPPSFAAYLTPHLPPRHFDNRSLDHPFYQAITAYLHQTTKGAIQGNNLNPCFMRMIESTFSWEPHLDTFDAGIEVTHPRSTDIETPFHPLQSLSVYQDHSHTHLLAPLAHHPAPLTHLQLVSPTPSQTTVVEGARFPDPTTLTQEEQRSFPSPNVWVVAHTSTSVAGKMVPWRVASLVAEATHYTLDSRTRASSQATPIAKAKALDAMARTVTLLASAWVQSGTSMGIALANSKFSRLCVLEGSSVTMKRPSSTFSLFSNAFGSRFSTETCRSATDDINIALEVPPSMFHNFPTAVFEYAELFEAKPIDAFYLLAHDLVASYDMTERPFMDLGSGQYTLNHAAAKRLWITLQRAVLTLGSLPWGQPLERLREPSNSCKEYANTILRRGRRSNKVAPPEHHCTPDPDPRAPTSPDRLAIGKLSTMQLTPSPSMSSFTRSKDAQIHAWIQGVRGTQDQESVPGIHDDNVKVKASNKAGNKWPVPEPVPKSSARVHNAAETKHVTATHDAHTRKIFVFFVSSDEMDRLVQLRAGDSRDVVPRKRPFFFSNRGCCFT